MKQYNFDFEFQFAVFALFVRLWRTCIIPYHIHILFLSTFFTASQPLSKQLRTLYTIYSSLALGLGHFPGIVAFANRQRVNVSQLWKQVVLFSTLMCFLLNCKIICAVHCTSHCWVLHTLRAFSFGKKKSADSCMYLCWNTQRDLLSLSLTEVGEKVTFGHRSATFLTAWSIFSYFKAF